MTTNPTVVLMASTGLGPTSQFHLPDGRTLFPVNTAVDVGTGLTTNLFGVPLQFRTLAMQAGLEAQSDLANRTTQGPTSARPSAPADKTSYYDQSIGRLIAWSAAANAWQDAATGRTV